MSISSAYPHPRGLAWVFEDGDFPRLWYVGLVVFMVRWMETLAMAVFVYQRTGSPFLVAMTQMLRLLPMGLLGAFLGVAADRIERRTALLATTLMMAASSGALAALAWADQLQVWHIMIACFVNGIGWAADNPVRRVAIGEVVGAERMGRAMSLDVAANNGSRMLGPTAGGVLLATLGIAGVFSLSIALYATSLLAIFLLRYRNRHAQSGAPAVFARIAEGLRAARQDARLLGVLSVTIIYNVFAWPFTAMVPVVAQGSLHLDDSHTGLLQSMDGIGAFLGALAIGIVVGRRHFALAFIGGAFSYLGTDHPLRAARQSVRSRRRPARRGHRRVRVQHHAGDARLPVRPGRDAQPDAGRAVGVHRFRADRLHQYRAARQLARRPGGDRGHRDRGIGGDGPGVPLMAADPLIGCNGPMAPQWRLVPVVS